WTERCEYFLPLRLRQSPEVELIVTAKKVNPLSGLRAFFRRLQRGHQRIQISGGQRVVDALIHRKVEHHLQSITKVAEVFQALSRRNIRLGKQDRIATPPLQEVAHLMEEFVILSRTDVRAFSTDQKRHGVHAKSTDAELQPETHDAQDLGPHRRV